MIVLGHPGPWVGRPCLREAQSLRSSEQKEVTISAPAWMLQDVDSYDDVKYYKN